MPCAFAVLKSCYQEEGREVGGDRRGQGPGERRRV